MVLEMLTGGGLVLIGWAVGRFAPARRRTPKPPAPTKPICGCTHELAYHDPEKGTCRAAVNVESRWDGYGDPIGWKQAPCACQQYTGPTPLPTVYAPEVTS
ncbi:hypothetical protein [Streptomyces sp.]|uniref:hypothetical protein n=1 Tax=Streptomyces sp. TaxID=1931 RepID=UPI002F91E6C2